MKVRIEQSWQNELKDEFTKPYFAKLAEFVRSQYKTTHIYPPARQIFAAFDACPFDKVKVVILGQDPYHGAGQANGLCFSVGKEVKIPPSLMNIFKELQTDLGFNPPKNGDLSRWAQQGVLLLNATLTVRQGQPGSHQNQGWETFTDEVVCKLSQKRNLVFILWGNYAREKAKGIDRKKNFLLESAHPSPFSADRGFFGSRPFSRTNSWLMEKGIEPIDWALKH